MLEDTVLCLFNVNVGRYCRKVALLPALAATPSRSPPDTQPSTPLISPSSSPSLVFCLTTQHLLGGGGLTPPTHPPSDPPP